LGDVCSFEALPADLHSAAMNEQVFTMDDMRLMHRCISYEEPLFADQDPEAGRRERDRQLEMAFRHPYLLHAKLSLAALELFHKDPSSARHYRLASSHNLAALRHARPNVTRSDREHAQVIYVFSSLTSLYAFIEPPLRWLSPEHRQSVNIIGDLIAAFRMGRGILAVMAVNAEHLEAAGQPERQHWPDDREEVLPTLEAEYPQLNHLRMLVNRCCKESVVVALHNALRNLFSTVSLFEKRPKDHSCTRLIMTWFMLMDIAVMDLCDARDPVAMVILAYFAVLVNLRRNIWFYERWPPVLLQEIERCLGGNLSEYLQWPRRMIFGAETPLSEVAPRLDPGLDHPFRGHTPWSHG
jgi:hypothetical protein